MSTKQEEREALQKIIKIIESLGEDSYLSFAFDGALEDAERNINEDAAYSYRSRYESVLKENGKLTDENRKLIEENRKLIEENRKLREENSKLLCSNIKRYVAYLDDGETVYKVNVPARYSKEVIEYCAGNGEVVAIKEIVEKPDSNNLSENDKIFAYRLMKYRRYGNGRYE